MPGGRRGQHPAMPSNTRTTSPLGSTGLDLTRVGLGAWAIGGPWDFGWGPQDESDSVAAIHEAIDQGVNWIDTAAVYGLGHSEEVVGRAVRELPRADRPMLFTKCGMVWKEGETSASRVGDPDSIRRECDASLQRLGVEVIDLLQIHWPPEDGTPVEEAWGALVELRDAGKIRFAGVSNFSPEQLTACERVGHVDSLQPPLSLLQRRALPSIEWAATHRTGVLVYSPMQSGLLTGRWSRQRMDELAPDDWRRRAEFFADDLEASLALVERLKPIAAREDASLAELAIAWTLHQPGVSAAIVGARRAGQVEGWIGAGENYLDPDTREEIAAALRETGAGAGPVPETRRT